MYIGLGIFLLVVGAILTFAVGDSVDAVNLTMIGYILMAGGVLAILLSFLVQAGGRRGRVTTTRESHVDPATGTRVDRTDIDPH
ncbi:DUF6458 family protein [Phycicoccus sonneratiae]|uniref:DUF6458 domain-containing protein n=1 Tax=Phycicoccus sonneratiae TaxID=2807628 RepID=A0ABS2CP13_9MICO|nr:DUF6458 family protein [Phycicoccus sonneraticus]MBM6401624.1 hypothetical protein [Phycicoccus sonneraticus]